MKTNETSSFRIVAADPDTHHSVIEAALCAIVAVAWVYADSPVSAWLWSMVAVVFLGVAFKSASQAVSRDKIEELEIELAGHRVRAINPEGKQ